MEDYFARGWSNEEFVIWLAGFFDGAGCLCTTHEGSVCLSIEHTNRDLIDSIARRLGVGSIEPVAFDRRTRKQNYVWRVRDYNQVRHVLMLIRPYLTIGASAADEAIRQIVKYVNRTQALRERDARIIELSEREGMSNVAIARLVGVSPSSVSLVLTRFRKEGLLAVAVAPQLPAPKRFRNVKSIRRIDE